MKVRSRKETRGNQRKESCYDCIAEDYHNKRKRPWKALERFLQQIHLARVSSRGYCLDIGCGNGRNFPLVCRVSNKIVGLDNSIELLKLAKNNRKGEINFSGSIKCHIQFVLCSINSIPIRRASIDGAFMIAVIHHVRGSQKRRDVLKQIYDLIKEKGWVIMSVWRKYQKKYRGYFLMDLIKRKCLPKYLEKQTGKGLSEFGDKLVPWTLSKENRTYSRFYHFFSGKEAKRLVREFKKVKRTKIGGPGKKDNFFYYLRKD